MDSPQLHRPVHSSSSKKYVDEDGKVRTLIAERHPFKRVENYFTDFLLYQESVETDEIPQPEEPNSGNEVDSEPEQEECLWKLEPLVTGTNKLDVDNTTDDAVGCLKNRQAFKSRNPSSRRVGSTPASQLKTRWLDTRVSASGRVGSTPASRLQLPAIRAVSYTHLTLPTIYSV